MSRWPLYLLWLAVQIGCDCLQLWVNIWCPSSPPLTETDRDREGSPSLCTLLYNWPSSCTNLLRHDATMCRFVQVGRINSVHTTQLRNHVHRGSSDRFGEYQYCSVCILNPSSRNPARPDFRNIRGVGSGQFEPAVGNPYRRLGTIDLSIPHHSIHLTLGPVDMMVIN